MLGNLASLLLQKKSRWEGKISLNNVPDSSVKIRHAEQLVCNCCKYTQHYRCSNVVLVFKSILSFY